MSRRKNDRLIPVLLGLNGVMFALNVYYLAQFQIVVEKVKGIISVFERTMESPRRSWKEDMEQ